MKQQDFLRDAMKQLKMTRKRMSERLGCSKRTLDKWLLPDNSSDHCPANHTALLLLTEILTGECLKKRCTDLEFELIKIKKELKILKESFKNF